MDSMSRLEEIERAIQGLNRDEFAVIAQRFHALEQERWDEELDRDASSGKGRMRSQATPRFWRLLQNLPEDVQRLASKNYHLWQSNPNHPSLRYRRLEGRDDLATVRVGDHYRALALIERGAVTWIWIGPHAEYDRLIRG